MPCNCGGGKNTEYVFTDPTTGQQKTYSTEIEAKAAQVRAGGGSIRTISK